MSSYKSSWFAHQLQTLLNRSQSSLTAMPQPAHRFVLFGTALSGGHLVVDVLRRAVDGRYGPLPITWTVEPLLEHRHFFPLQHIRRHGAACSNDLFGFRLSAMDLMVTHGMGEPHRFMTLLHDQGYQVIHLQRQDLMRHAIAILKSKSPTNLHIDPQKLIATLKQLDEQRIAESTIVAQVPHLAITYETDLLNPNVHNATAQRLCHFLSLRQRQPLNCTMKLVHQKISDLVSNYDQICTALERSDYAYVLSEASAKLVI